MQNVTDIEDFKALLIIHGIHHTSQNVTNIESYSALLIIHGIRCTLQNFTDIENNWALLIIHCIHRILQNIENFKTLLIIHEICNGRRRYFLQSKIFHVKKMQKKEKKMVIRESSAEIVKKSEFLRLTQNF